MDDIDRKILKRMQQDAAASVADIASAVGLSQTPCWRRIKRMEQEGVILGRALLIDGRKVGLGVDVFAQLKLRMHDEATLDALELMTSEHPQIVECFSMSGESDYIMRIVVGSIDDYEYFLKSVLLHLPGVASVNSSFALKRVKITHLLPI